MKLVSHFIKACLSSKPKTFSKPFYCGRKTIEKVTRVSFIFKVIIQNQSLKQSSTLKPFADSKPLPK